MSPNAVVVAEKVNAVITSRDLVALLTDPEELLVARAAVEEYVEPDFEIAMIGPEYTPQGLTGHGFEGFLTAWTDWTSAYATYRIDIEEIVDAGDRIVSLGRQTATTRTGGVEVDADAAAVMTVRDGRISRMEFYLDREAALRSAGLA